MNNNYTYNLLIGVSLEEVALQFHHRGHGYGSEHSPEKHWALLKQAMNNCIGICIYSNNNPEVLLIISNGVCEDIHIRGKGIHGHYLASLATKHQNSCIKYLHGAMVQLCHEHQAEWYTIPRRTGEYQYTLKYFKVGR